MRGIVPFPFFLSLFFFFPLLFFFFPLNETDRSKKSRDMCVFAKAMRFHRKHFAIRRKGNAAIDYSNVSITVPSTVEFFLSFELRYYGSYKPCSSDCKTCQLRTTCTRIKLAIVRYVLEKIEMIDTLGFGTYSNPVYILDMYITRPNDRFCKVPRYIYMYILL